MRVISKPALNQFIERIPKAAEPVIKWYLLCKEGAWKNFSELKKDFRSVDAVGDHLYVFNVGGNKYRIIARIFFGVQTMYIRFIGTHAEYDKVKLSDL
jgi:mRNA interferase HigB